MSQSVRRLSVSLRLVLALVLVSLLAGQAFAIHVDGLDDTACLPQRATDDREDRIGGSGILVAQDHCYTCHWQRSLRSMLQLVSSHDLRPADESELPHGAVLLQSRASLTRLPARSPPA